MNKKLSIIFFQRKPFQDFVSIEHIFDMVRSQLREAIEARVFISKYESKGIWKRVYNIIEAKLRQGKINHITGDVHFLTFLLSRKTTILSLHATYNPNPSKVIQWILGVIWWRIPLHRVDYVTAVSIALKNEVVERFGCDAEKISVIYNPVNPIFTKHKKPFAAKPIILQVGTKSAKNIERLIAGLDGIPCHLHIVGVLVDKHLQLLQKHHIDFSNSINLSAEEMNEAYRNCDLLALVSVYEGFGMPIIEANAVGRAVITGDIAAMREVANDAALLVNPYDIKAIRKGILKLIDDEEYRNQLIENGFKNVKRFQLDSIANQYLELYEKVEGRRKD